MARQDIVMALREYPSWIRGFDIIIGFIVVFVGVWIILYTAIVEAVLVLLLALGLLLIGFTRLGKGIMMKELNQSTRIIKIVSGVSAVGLAIGALLFTSLTVAVLITLLTFGIMLLGLARIAVGYKEKEIRSSLRAFYIVGGIIVFIFGFIAAIYPALGLYALRIILAVTFLILGSLRVASGASGELR
jgi:uncharacterized membrane protein HdeD (DUF308 family)